MTRMPLCLPYASCEEVGDRPHVMVDGAARPGSVLTLSHWPQSPTPPALARDLSAEIVLDLQRCSQGLGPGTPPPGRPEQSDPVMTAVVSASRAEAVTSDHFDEDGLVALFGLVDPEAAIAAGETLVGVASCGDFGVVRSDVSARVCFAIGPLATAEAGAHGPTAPGGRSPSTSDMYSAVLPRLPELLAHPERFRRCWAEQWETFTAARAAIEQGAVTIEEYPEVDLAIFRGPDGLPNGAAPSAGERPLHRAAVHSATSASRILAFIGERCELYFRYESWVRLVSRKVPLRPHLGPLALELSEAEPSGGRWEENGPGALVAWARPAGGRTEIDPAAIVTAVRRYLASAPPAWDPFREDGGYIPPREQGSYVASFPGSPAAARGRRRGRLHRRA
jgi:hypothetical protein